MIMQNRRSNCCDARPYYYDILCEESHEEVPNAALTHVRDCNYCQREIVRLEGVLNGGNTPSAAESRRDAKLLQLLRLHFSCADKPVSCSIVKPFLPSMADELVRVRIPTPITTHIDQCTRCASALNALRDIERSQESSGRLVPVRLTGEAPSTCFGVKAVSENGETVDANASGVEIPISVHKPCTRSSAKEWPFVKTGLQLLASHVGKIAALVAISVTAFVLTGIPIAGAGPGSLWHEAIQNAPYFHASCTFPEKDTPKVEIWILRDEGKYVKLTGGKSSFYDLPGGKIRTTLPGMKPVVASIPPDLLRDWEQKFQTLAGIVSFQVLDNIPAHAMHRELKARVHQYEWQSSAGGRRSRCVVSLAADRDFPVKLEVFVKEPGQDEFQPDRTIRIYRPSKNVATAKAGEYYPGS
jgi:hypothetical protein